MSDEKTEKIEPTSRSYFVALFGGIFRFVITASIIFSCFLMYKHISAKEASLGLSSFITVKVVGVTYNQLVILIPVFALYLLIELSAISLTTLSRYNPEGCKELELEKRVKEFLICFFWTSIVGLCISLVGVVLWFSIQEPRLAFQENLAGLLLRAAVLGMGISLAINLFFGWEAFVEKDYSKENALKKVILDHLIPGLGEIKRGSKVRVKRTSKYYDPELGEGWVMENFGAQVLDRSLAATVLFTNEDDTHSYRKEDLELV